MAELHRRTHLLASLTVVAAFLLVSLAHPVSAQTAGGPRLVQVINTAAWPKPSPDPSGITYWPTNDTLVIADGEVEEMAIFAGANIFESTRTGTLLRSYDISDWNNEPVGIDIDVSDTGDFFIANDSAKRIFQVNLGPDGQFDTADDSIRSFLTSSFGNTDPEGLTLGRIGGQQRLFTVDGAATRVYITNPGPNGIFEGAGDDTTTSFDVLRYGVEDPEGIEYNSMTGTLYLVDRKKDTITEITTDGTFIRSFSLRSLFAGVQNPADLTLAPGSRDSTILTLYIVERGVDNNDNPNENDGKIYEVSLDGNGAPPPPSGNLLANPSFEAANTSGQPSSWSTHPIFTRSSAAAHAGSYAGRFAAANEDGATIRQQVSGLAGGTTYSFSGWVNIPSTSDAFNFRLRVKWRDSSGTAISTVTIATFTAHTSGSWVQRTASLTAPAGTASAEVMLTASNLSSVIYVDELTFGP